MNTIKIDSKNVKMVAHRGLSGLECENTCPAFVAAGNRSYYGIETDVHVTADGKFVIIHDESTLRVSGGTVDANVEQSTFESIKHITLPDHDGSCNRRDTVIPLLEDYIRICKKYEKICVLELKNPFKKEDIEKLICEINSIGYLENMIFISFDFNNCVILRSLLPDAQIQWLISEEITDEVIEKLCDNKLDLDVYYKRLSKELTDKLHNRGIIVNCWTCDSKEDGEALVAMGVDYITSNILE